MELPPLRLPRIGNVAVKTYTRIVWYFKEVLPLFVLASVLIWLGRATGLFEVLVNWLKPVVHLIGLPDDAAVAFLFGFFRRDYGAAGLYDLHKGGAMTGNQLAVAAITLTLFLPCIAQFLMMKKEHGTKLAFLMGVGIFILAFLVGGLVNLLLNITGATL
jgi:ferrous iron transport protein B